MLLKLARQRVDLLPSPQRPEFTLLLIARREKFITFLCVSLNKFNCVFFRQ